MRTVSPRRRPSTLVLGLAFTALLAYPASRALAASGDICRLPPHVVNWGNIRSVHNVLLVTVEGRDAVFLDVPATAWYAPYVATVAENGIAGGYRDARRNLTGRFGPADPVTYAELATMILNATGDGADIGANMRSRLGELGFSLYTPGLNLDAPAPRGAAFYTLVETLHLSENGPLAGSGSLCAPRNASSVSSSPTGRIFRDLHPLHPLAPAIHLLVRLGIVEGDRSPNGVLRRTIRPNDSVSRAEIAKIFTKLIEAGYIAE